jgi:hypothetical protein
MRKYLLTALAVLATSTVFAQPPANYPAGVPNDYVITPFGYYHSSCVHTLAEGQPNTGGTPCAHPAFHPDGTPKVEGETPSAKTPTINGWIESTNITAPTGKSFSAVYVTNVVPPTPANFEGQTLFFFPGLEDINNTQSILQPVLIYNVGGWSISNYNCCLSGVTNSTPIPASPGDTIVSSITENCRPGTLTCATWDVVSLDLKNHKSTSLLKTPSDGQIFNWAFGAVLEPYNVNYCDDYPSKDEAYEMLVLDEQGLPVTPKWNVSVNTTVTPQCGYGINAKPFENTLQYNSTIVTVPPPTVTISRQTASLWTLFGSDNPMTEPALVLAGVTVAGLASGESVTLVLSETTSIPGLLVYFDDLTTPAGATINNQAATNVTFTQNGSMAFFIQDESAAPATTTVLLTATPMIGTTAGTPITLPIVVTTN